MSFSRKLKRQLEAGTTKRGHAVRRAACGLALAAVLGAGATAPTLAWDDELALAMGDDLVQLTPDQLDALRGGLSIGPFSFNFAVTITTTINNALSLQTKLTMDIQEQTHQIVSAALDGAYTPATNKTAGSTTTSIGQNLGQNITASVTNAVAANAPNGEQLANEIKNNVNEALVGFLPSTSNPQVAGAQPASNQPTPSPVNPAPLLDVSPDNIANGNLFTGGGTDPITSSVDLASAIIDNAGDFGSIASTVAQLPVETVNQVVNGGNLPSGEQIANQVVNGGNLPSGEEIASQVVDTLVGSAQNLVPTQDDTSDTSNTSNTNNTNAASEVEVVDLPGGTQFNVGDQTSILHQLDGGIVSQIQNTASNLDIQQFVELNISIANFTQFLTSGIQKALADKFNGELSRFGSTLGSN